MHSLRLPGVPLFHSFFRKHRFDSDPTTYSLNLSLPKHIATPAWAFFPSPPMSGSSPPERPLEQSHATGRRRKRSDTPTTTAPPVTSTTVTNPESPIETRRGQRYGGLTPQAASSIPPPRFPSTYPVTQSDVYGPAGPAPVGPSVARLEPHFTAGQLSPKATRKTKAHVASACVNCKKKHLRCDNARPCHRCVQAGKEVSREQRSPFICNVADILVSRTLA